MKLIRTDHAVTLWVAGKAEFLKNTLKNVPDSAVLIDIEEDDAGNTVLVYRDESEQPKTPDEAAPTTCAAL